MKSLLKDFYGLISRQLLKHGQEKNQLCYFYTFPNNNFFLADIIEQGTWPVIIIYRQSVKNEVISLKERYPQIECVSLEQQWFLALKKIKSSRLILCDNYEPLLASMTSTTQRKVMIWHATGALKCFGICDPKNKERTKSDNRRFKAVYQSYTDFIVASELMGEIFKKSYLATDKKIHPIGFPRTDNLVNVSNEQLRNQFFAKNPDYKGKDIVLYAPTYRENHEHYPFDDAMIREALPNSIVIYHYHPHHQAPSTPIDATYEELLAVSDYCITDYSSLPFDYTLVHPKGRVILYQYDQDSYNQRYGLEPLFMDTCPFPIAKTMDEVVTCLNKEQRDFTLFNNQWNTFNDGKATQRLLDLLGEKQ